MTTEYPIVPLAWLDDIHNLNCSLDAYQRLVTTWISAIPQEGYPTDTGAFVAGLDLMFQPILEGFRDLQSQINQAKELRLVATPTARPEENHAVR
ncbi:hypothetical protein [Pseudomonas aeruginosa]|uniref:hypothetical protein n=1 Tax=Pseudomonas aeruginosa TaxID=287 RepID=UPI00053D68EB|nr:hypothetical protein [Pseudomonas aeruginosa]EJU9618392.1 hypothetical protein [Pseudomonas aeruginosa]